MPVCLDSFRRALININSISVVRRDRFLAVGVLPEPPALHCRGQ